MFGVSQALFMFNSEKSLPCKTHYDNVSFHFDYLHVCSIHRNNSTVNMTHQCTFTMVINTSGYIQISPPMNIIEIQYNWYCTMMCGRFLSCGQVS